MIRRTILEWNSLPYGPGDDAIPQGAADRLAAVAATSTLAGRGGGGVLEYGRRALRARGVVGVIVAKDCALEILPKIDTPGQTGSAATGHIRKRLIHMLAVALNTRIETGAITDLEFQRETLLDILIKLFAIKLIDALRHGMPRCYAGQVDDLPMLRGRLDAARQFTTLIATPQKLACRYDTLSENMPLNQIIKAAVIRLVRVARSIETQQRLREMVTAYSEVSDVPVPALRWDLVIIDRTNARWKEIIDLAQLLLGDRFQTTSAGAAAGFSLMFEMNVLFEEYVARMLARALAGTGRHIVAQGGRLFCLRTEDGRGLFQTKPDILVKRGSVVEQIIDTKWKRIATRLDDPKQGVAQSDIYQMMAYGQLYQCPRLTLLYPHHHELGSASVNVSHQIAVSGCADCLELMTVDISSSDNVVQRLRTLCPDDAGAEAAGV